MAIGANLSDLGLSGLRAAQIGLATTSHNIANAGTAGYSRQRVELATATPILEGGSYFGTGTRLVDVRRSYDQLLTRELLTDTAAAAQDRVQHGLASQLDALFSDSATGLAPMLQGYFDALEDAAADPSSGTARQVLLDQADQLATRFRTLDSRLQQARADVEGNARTSVDRINALASGIAQLNLGIVQAQGMGAAPNDLLDQRDELVRQLAEQVAVTTQVQDDGALNVFIGSGQTLVMGAKASRLAVVRSDADPAATGLVLLGSGGGGVEVTDQIRGGALGAQIGFERGLLADAERQLGQIALGLTDAMNAQHRLGMDQNGKIGGDLFTALNDPALVAQRAQGHGSNTGEARLEVTVDSLTAFRDSDYVLTYDGTDYRLVQASDSRVVGMFADLPQTFADEGFSIDLAQGAMAAGDSFTIRPAAGAAGAMRMVLSDTASLALASPVRGTVSADNLGDARIGSVSATGLSGLSLADPVTLTYDAASGGFLVGSPPGGTLPYDPAADSGSSLTLSVTGFGDLAFSISRTPADGDTFTIEANRGGTGDNANALSLSALQDSGILRQGTATLAQGYERAVSLIASRISGLALAADAQEALLQRAQASREALSGVNLDEEAAALLQYQQAYEASARVIAVSNELFQTLLGALRG